MSESGIDMDRCLLGIDDEKAWTPEITWHNCARQMPPKTTRVILRPKEFPIATTHYKLLSPMPPTEQPNPSPKAPGSEISPSVI